MYLELEVDVEVANSVLEDLGYNAELYIFNQDDDPLIILYVTVSINSSSSVTLHGPRCILLSTA